MSSISAGTTSGTALVTSGDTTGQLVFKTNGSTTALTLNTDQTATFVGAISAPSISIGGGALPVSSGGTGATTLTGVIKGNGTSAFTASNVSLTSEVTGTLPVANGGTGTTSLTANNVILGNGTSSVQFVAPGSSGNVLTSNGTTWQSSAPAAGGFSRLTVVTSSSTFTIPTGVTIMKVTVVGAGGGGAGASGGTDGSSGGTTSVDSGTQTITTISATGGGGGRANGSSGTPSGGSGSATGSNFITIRGSGGSGPLSSTIAIAAGSSFLGGGGGGTSGTNTGENGGLYGGGGSGGAVSGVSGGSGGGGGAAIQYISGLTPGNTLLVTIGSGGTAGTGARAGGTGANGVVVFEY